VDLVLLHGPNLAAAGVGGCDAEACAFNRAQVSVCAAASVVCYAFNRAQARSTVTRCTRCTRYEALHALHALPGNRHHAL
jgi:hypothetical protein